jgi:hypothetical protein
MSPRQQVEFPSGCLLDFWYGLARPPSLSWGEQFLAMVVFRNTFDVATVISMGFCSLGFG